MYCPRCGQQQLSDEVRFCPRCGLSLAPHAALLAGGDATAAGLGGVQAPALTKKRVSTRRANKLMFFSVASLPVFLGLSIAVDEPVPLLLPFIVFMAGLAWRVYSALFGEDTPVAQKQGKDTARFGRRDAPSLEAPRSAPASWQSTQRTTELSQPPSVTEQTTTLLDQDRPSSST